MKRKFNTQKELLRFAMNCEEKMYDEDGNLLKVNYFDNGLSITPVNNKTDVFSNLENLCLYIKNPPKPIPHWVDKLPIAFWVSVPIAKNRKAMFMTIALEYDREADSIVDINGMYFKISRIKEVDFSKTQSELMNSLRDRLNYLEKQEYSDVDDDYTKKSIELIKDLLEKDKQSPILKSYADCVELQSFLDAV